MWQLAAESLTVYRDDPNLPCSRLNGTLPKKLSWIKIKLGKLPGDFHDNLASHALVKCTEKLAQHSPSARMLRILE